MAKSKCNIACSIWRSFEILLFFAISVVGLNVLKTTSLNTKSKEKTLSEKVATQCELSRHELTFNSGLIRLKGFFSPKQDKNLSLSAASGIQSFSEALDQRQFFFPGYSPFPEKEYISSLFLPFKPANLLQQNPVLLI
ncbi:MAG: hypothetical protein HGB36_01960 [Chlorobiaceae bacterium]|jgi:hypothetical protein|nr:hypothetical protein [Chlorobiaceae bacterium]